MNDVQRTHELVDRFLDEIPGGIEGDREIRRRIDVPFMDLTDEDVRRGELTDAEIQGWFDYVAWNLWDLIANRQTEGESGLIPRQEYETIGFVHGWETRPDLIRMITETIGVEGVIELGRIPRRTLGSKVHQSKHWSAVVCPLLGRGISVQLGYERPEARRDDVAELIQFGRRLQYGSWGEGCGFVSGREFISDLLDDEVVARLLDDEERLEDPQLRARFLRMNATTELLGFLVHYDCRAGLSQTGPYPVPGGGFMLVRDHWLNETRYPWSTPTADLPYCLVEAMVFRPDEPVDIRLNDIHMVRAKPANYHAHLSGVAVYARDTRDTPMDQLRRLDADAMEQIADKASAATLELYKTIAAKTRDEKIRDGMMVYNYEQIGVYLRHAGLWDRVAPTFNDLGALTARAYETLAAGEAQSVLRSVFLTGAGFPPVAATPASGARA